MPKRIFLRLFHAIARLFIALWHWLTDVTVALTQLWRSLGPRWLKTLLVLAILAVAGLQLGKHLLQPNLTREVVYTIRYLDQGWDEADRQRFYYTPQGSSLLGIPYSWFVNLELPLSRQRLASAGNMRGWGFSVSPGQLASEVNPGDLPVGFGRYVDPLSGEEHLDIGCAACHTGELHFRGTVLSIDGGQSLHSLPSRKRGEFFSILMAALVETAINPAKWHRFAERVTGNDDQRREQLREQVWALLGRLNRFISGPGASSLYPVEEGRGRIDAVGRLANLVFGDDLDEPDNYHRADAPVSIPYLWDSWRSDWGHYTGFINQAMARNVAKSLGLLAPVKLVDNEGRLLQGEDAANIMANIDGIRCVESLLRKLKPPKWPEQILGSIDIASATRGKGLFQDKCESCHGPHLARAYAWQIATGPEQNPDQQIAVNWQWDMKGDITYRDGIGYRDDWRERIWAVPWIASEVIGTDPTAADNFMDNTYKVSKLQPDLPPVNVGNGLQVLLNELVPNLYATWKIDGDKVPDYDGLNVPLRISNRRAYRARPLHGVWATPPYLHNGSVPTIYDLLSPLEARPIRFAVGKREYDPARLGYTIEPGPGSFIHDTTLPGNANSGHLFTDTASPGRIGGRLTERERMDLIEYIKVMGNPDFSEPLGGDPQNWAQYSRPPGRENPQQACRETNYAQEDRP